MLVLWVLHLRHRASLKWLSVFIEQGSCWRLPVFGLWAWYARVQWNQSVFGRTGSLRQPSGHRLWAAVWEWAAHRPEPECQSATQMNHRSERAQKEERTMVSKLCSKGGKTLLNGHLRCVGVCMWVSHPPRFLPTSPHPHRVLKIKDGFSTLAGHAENRGPSCSCQVQIELLSLMEEPSGLFLFLIKVNMRHWNQTPKY